MAGVTGDVVESKQINAQLEEKLGHGAVDEAKLATDAEHQMGVLEALKKHKKAVFWSFVISMSIIMEGYDTILMLNFWAYPTFQRKFGNYYGEELGWLVSGPWQVGLSNASVCGTIIGGLINGWATSKYGYRLVMMVAMFFMNAFIFIVFFAPNAKVLLVGEILCGVTWGVFATSAPAYASEVCPLALRGYLTVYVNLCWAIGQFIAAGVLNGLINMKSEWGYRIPFAIQWVWPAPLLVIYFFAPDSPWYLVRKDRIEEAKKNLKRLGYNSQEDINGNVAMMVHTIQRETELTSGGSYVDCFKGVDLRRTEVCCVAFAGQILSGSTFAYSPTFFYTQAGIDKSNSYKLGFIGTSGAFLGTILSWFLLSKFGRRTLYLAGQSLMSVLLFIVGIVSVATHTQGGLWAQAAFITIWIFVYALTVGPITYSIVAETSAMRLRAQTVCLARVTYQIINIISNVLVPYQMNPTEWNWQGKTAFFWCGTGLCITFWAFFRLPEAKGRTYEELDIMFANKVPARKFSQYEVDAYASSSQEKLTEVANSKGTE